MTHLQFANEHNFDVNIFEEMLQSESYLTFLTSWMNKHKVCTKFNLQTDQIYEVKFNLKLICITLQSTFTLIGHLI